MTLCAKYLSQWKSLSLQRKTNDIVKRANVSEQFNLINGILGGDYMLLKEKKILLNRTYMGFENRGKLWDSKDLSKM